MDPAELFNLERFDHSDTCPDDMASEPLAVLVSNTCGDDGLHVSERIALYRHDESYLMSRMVFERVDEFLQLTHFGWYRARAEGALEVGTLLESLQTDDPSSTDAVFAQLAESVNAAEAIDFAFAKFVRDFNNTPPQTWQEVDV